MLSEIPKHLKTVLKSQQYIHNSYTIIKELVENSLDAGSSVIKISLDSASIIVDDNGKGIEDLEKVCQMGYTSKENNTYKILGIKPQEEQFYHGFRGQALSSIREMCDVEITSKTTLLDNENDLGVYKNFSTGEIRKCPREIGTTVKVTNLFKTCNIRKQINEKFRRKNLTLIINLLNSFCYIYTVQFILIDKGKVILNSKGSGKLKEFSISKHGDKFLEVDDESFYLILFPLCKDQAQIMIYESRIVQNNKLHQIILNCSKKFYDCNPTYIILVKEESDINLSNDKSEIIIKNFKYIENRIKSEIDLYFSSLIHIQSTDSLTHKDKNIVNDQSKEYYSPNTNLSISENDKFVHPKDSFNFKNSEKISAIRSEDTKVEKLDKNLFKLTSSNMSRNINITSDKQDSSKDEIGCEIKNDVTEKFKDENNKNNSFEDNYNLLGNHIIKNQENKPNYNSTVDDSQFPWKAYSMIHEEVLSHPDITIKKDDFKKMKIVGQFNQGFILCTLSKENGIFLITVDQHAADEIFNFEKLQKSFLLKKQMLLNPIKLKLTPLQELLVEDNKIIFEKNGFIIKDNQLVTVPTYKSTIFSVDDLYSLIDNISNGIHESEKFRNIMASKACRTSIMIGKALTLKEMQKVLDNLSTLNLPWNCPHGRPTFKIITKL